MSVILGTQKINKIYSGSKKVVRGYVGSKPFFTDDQVSAPLHLRRIPSSPTENIHHHYVGREVRLGPGYAADLAPLHVGDLKIVGISYISNGTFEGQINVYLSKYPVPFILVFTNPVNNNSYTLNFPISGGGLANPLPGGIFTYDKVERDENKRVLLTDIFGGDPFRSGSNLKIELTA